MVIVVKLMEWILAGETKELGENLPQHHFVHHKSPMTRPGLEHEPPLWEASLSYGADLPGWFSASANPGSLFSNTYNLYEITFW
jgi:hypothetical protein